MEKVKAYSPDAPETLVFTYYGSFSPVGHPEETPYGYDAPPQRMYFFTAFETTPRIQKGTILEGESFSYVAVEEAHLLTPGPTPFAQRVTVERRFDG